MESISLVTMSVIKIKIKCFYGRNIKSARELHHQVTRKTRTQQCLSAYKFT